MHAMDYGPNIAKVVTKPCMPSPLGTKKQLQTTPDFKQHYFEALQNLDEDFQLSVLRKVKEREMSLAELKLSATEFRAMKLAKAIFVR